MLIRLLGTIIMSSTRLCLHVDVCRYNPCIIPTNSRWHIATRWVCVYSTFAHNRTSEESINVHLIIGFGTKHCRSTYHCDTLRIGVMHTMSWTSLCCDKLCLECTHRSKSCDCSLRLPPFSDNDWNDIRVFIIRDWEHFDFRPSLRSETLEQLSVIQII